MSRIQPSPDRFVGLDMHKHYLIAAAVDPDRKEVMSPRRVLLEQAPGARKVDRQSDHSANLSSRTSLLDLHSEPVSSEWQTKRR